MNDSISSFPCIPNWPATAAIPASSVCATGILRARALIASPKTFISLFVKPVVFLTEAIASSNSANERTAATPMDAIATEAATATAARPKGPNAAPSLPAEPRRLVKEVRKEPIPVLSLPVDVPRVRICIFTFANAARVLSLAASIISIVFLPATISIYYPFFLFSVFVGCHMQSYDHL